MPNKRCVVTKCSHTTWLQKTLTFYSFPEDDKPRRKWIKAVSLWTLKYWRELSDGICSRHFPHGRKLGNNNILSFLPRWDFKTKHVVYPVNISKLLKEKLYPVDENDAFTVQPDYENNHGENEADNSEINETSFSHFSVENNSIIDESEDLKVELGHKK